VPTTEVAIYDDYFSPKSIQVVPGSTVRFTNKGKKPHAIAELTGAWSSPELAPNDSWSVTLRRPLNHYYYCRHHRLTMNASIVVK
jgi:plastocyanin